VIDTDQKLQAFLPQLRASPWIALDTEADSLHAYPEKLCLLQISLPGADVLLDPLSGMKMSPVLEVLAGRELILHGADYDLRLLRKGFGFVPTLIFDTMLASRLVGCREFGLTHLVEKFLNVKLEKGPQKANWARRPLTERMETYASNDTRYLKPLADLLHAQLKEKGRLKWHEETCARLVADCSVPRTPDLQTVWRVKGSSKLKPRALALLREIWYWREQEALSANKPPYFILSPETMVGLAAAAAEPDFAPHTLPLPRNFSQRRQRGLRHAIEKGLIEKHPPTPIRARRHRQTEAQKKLLGMLEQKRDKRAEELGIDPTLIANRATLVLLSHDWKNNQSVLMKWQRDLLE